MRKKLNEKKTTGETPMLDAETPLMDGVIPPNCWIVLLDEEPLGPLDKGLFDDIYAEKSEEGDFR